VDAFTLSATGAADRATAVTVALSPAGAFAYVAAVEVTDAAGTPYGSAAPASDTVPISLGTGIAAPLEPATPATYYVRIVPKGHAAMPPPPGGAYAVAATVAGISSANPTKLVNDSASGTVTIDNLAPARPAWGAVTVSSGSVSLAWVPPADAPFVVLLRRTGGAILDAPVDGQPVGATLGASDVIYAGTGLTIANVAANGSAYHYRLSARDACGNHGGGAALGPIVPPGPAEGDPARWSSKPTVAIVNPTTGAVTTGPFRVQVRVTSPPDASGVPQPIEWVKLTTDGSTTVTAAWRELTRNANFGQAGDVAMYELQLSSLPAATYTLRARARNASGEASSAAIGIRVNDAAGGKKGDGNLLVRDNASRLCSDCHTHQTHGSATAGTVDAGGQRLSKYGAWTTNCRDCHTPHGTPNLFLLRPQITPPAVAAYQPPRDTRIQSDAGYSGAAPGEKPSYANADGTGPCQVCHTRTQGLGGAARFRNGLNDDTHYTSRTERCGDCHNHQSGFRGKTCAECHLGGESELDQASHAAGDGVVARISASEWMKYGHGAPTDPSDPVHGDEYPSGKPRARLDGQGKKLGDRGCAYCHTASTSHDEPFNFFRLANRELGPNGPCLVCHDRSASGFDPDGPSGDAYDLVDGRDAPGGHGSHSAINHTGGFFCWDCHDAHGDVSASGRPLWSMLRRRLVEQSVTSAADPAFGKPDLTQIPSPLTAEIEFDPSVGGTAALDLPDYYAGGLCRNCHDARDPASTGVPGVKWFNKTTADLAAHALSAEDGQSCSSCHIHRTSCGNCHGVAPATGNHRTHLELAEPQMERGSVDHIFATNDAYAYGCGKCHAPGTHGDDRDGHTGTSSDPFPVNVGFDTTVPPASDPASSYQRVGGTLLSPGADGRYWSYTDGTCLNNACHSNGAPVDRPIVYDNSPTWMQNTGRLRCDACHAGAGGTTWSRGHDKHVNAAYGYGCERCHSSVVSSSTGITNKSLHVNGAAEVRFDDVGLVKNLQAGYDASARTCSATYCHSDGTNVAAPGGVSVAWTAIGQAGCDSCHPGDAGLPRTIATFAHGAHVNQRDVLGTNVTCEACHATTVSGDRTLTSIANHVDGEPDVSMVVAGVGASGTYFGGICSNNYCHSAGLSRVAVENEAYAVGWKGGETLDCKGCHGRHSQASFVASPLGEPNYVSAGAGVVKANSHAQHLRGMTCADCHPDTVDALGRPILDGTKHVDGVRDVRMAQGTYDGAVGAKRCSSTACHANGAPQWGGSSPCQECHVGASDRPSWNIEDGVVALISSGEWSTRGHGRPDATMDCLHCHTSSTGHYVSENPYRLANFNATSLTPGGDGWNSNCLVCHATNATSFGGKAASAAARVDAYHYGTKHGDTNDGGRRCWDCHDVHGDGSNARMIGDEIVVDAADPFGLVASRATGVRYTPANPAAPADTDYANAAFTGICNVCHRSTATAPATATAYFNDAVSDFGHSSGQACIACHPHTEPGFVPNLAWAGKGGSCTGCHHGNAYAYLKAGDPKYATTSYVVRKTSADWSLTSRHGGNGGQFMGGAVTDGDCIVCHFEGNLGSDGKAVENGTWHKNRVVDLRDADDNTKSFAYDKFAIHADVERTGGNASSWSSANGAWRTQTSTALDPFCLTCHDSNGAMASCRLGDSRALADCRNDPFGDKAITNEYDQQPRLDAQGRPVITDVRSRVSIYVDLNGDGVMDAPVNRDATGEAPDTNGIEDPPNGVYSRHAIRGQSRSVYTTYATPLGTSSDGGAFFSLFQARNTGYTGLPMLTSMGSDENGPLWNDTSVMGCADCHTVDGANAPANPANPAGTFGNAHGSSSEYLLKNSAGLAASSTWNSTTQENTYVCARCHTGNVYTYSIGRHGGSKSDYVDSVGLLGATNRKGAAGSIFGISCQNCHGGSPWGSIHGTTETFGVGQGGAGGTRRAYRFTNGGALRYYNPNSWVLRESTCYTLSGGDGWSNCTAHTTARGSTRAKQFQRPLRY
jgi:predicted CxxxxCH...CXXCH cytochrome family protein